MTLQQIAYLELQAERLERDIYRKLTQSNVLERNWRERLKRHLGIGNFDEQNEERLEQIRQDLYAEWSREKE